MFASNLESDAKDCGYELIPYEEAIVQVARTLKLARPEDIEEPVSKAIISELSARLRITLDIEPSALEQFPVAVKKALL